MGKLLYINIETVTYPSGKNLPELLSPLGNSEYTIINTKTLT